jgi:tRNA (mo5U34)-methyltransferase
MGLKEKIDSFPYWYHRINLNGIETPGFHPHLQYAYEIPENLTGKRVLDVGAWDGYWTFEALKRGAKEVVAIDDWSDMPYLDKSGKPRIEWDTFDFCKRTLGYTDEQCKRYTMKVYDVKELGMFDVIFFFGTLYHCRYPLLALDKLSEICSDEIYIETAICDDFSPYKGFGQGYNKDNDFVMEFYPEKQLGDIETNWWSPTSYCLSLMVRSAGWKDTRVWKFTNPQSVPLCRGFAKGKK